MDNFNGKYFDGKSYKAHDILIYLVENSIDFSFLEPQIEPQKNSWKIENIKVENLNPNHSLILSYGDFPKQTIEINNQEQINLIIQKYPVLFKNNFISNVFGKHGLQIIFSVLLVIVLVFITFYKFIFPIITTKIVANIPIEKEILLGKKMAASYLNEINTTENTINTNKSKLLNNYFIKTKFKSNYPVKIYFIDEDVVNAFAIPGGTIVVYRGIINKMKSSNELSALLAHELAHIEKRHSLYSIIKGLSNYVLLSIVTSDISGIVAILIDNVMLFKNLSNSREFEKEADLVGFNYLVENKLPTSGLVSLMLSIEDKTNSKKDKFNIEDSFSYLSTHPTSLERINYINLKIKNQKLENSILPARQDLEAIFNSLKNKN